MSGCELLQPPPPNCIAHRSVVLFDVDNTSYRQITGVGALMQDYIRRYIVQTSHSTPDQAEHSHQKYYSEYGLAIEGLVRENHVNAMDYNARVDDASPSEKCLKPDARLREMLCKIDRTRYKSWLCTNAYRNHGIRVVQLSGISEFFEGITYCNYARRPSVCKPMPEFFVSAMADVGIQYDGKEPDRPIYFVDDSAQNVSAAEKFGWKAARIDEPAEAEEPDDMSHAPLGPPLHEGGLPQLHYLSQLPLVFPEIFDTKHPTDRCDSIDSN